MLNARIEIKTSESPYKVNRQMPTLLTKYFQKSSEWMIFCDRIDLLLRSYEEIKAQWMVIGVCFVFLMIGLIVGIVCRYALVDDNQDLGVILSTCLFGGILAVFVGYFCFMRCCIIRPLHQFKAEVDDYCNEVASKWDSVDFKFEVAAHNVYWGSDFDAWINVTSTDAMDLEK